MKPTRKPPLGLAHEHSWKQGRILDIARAISRYLEAGMHIPTEWVEEYNRLIKEG